MTGEEAYWAGLSASEEDEADLYLFIPDPDLCGSDCYDNEKHSGLCPLNPKELN